MKTFAVLLWDCVLMTKKTVTIQAESQVDADRQAKRRWGSQVSQVTEVVATTDLQEEEA